MMHNPFRNWLPKRQTTVLMREKLFEQNPERTHFYQRMLEAARRQ